MSSGEENIQLFDTGEETGIEMAEENEIKTISEREDLLNKGKRAAKTPKCRQQFCKGVVISVAVVVFVAMMVQIWSDYGEYIQTHTFPPKIYSLSEQCPENKTHCMTKNYNAPSCEWKPRKPYIDLVCTLNKLEHHMVDVSHDFLQVDMIWDNFLNITFKEELSSCVHITIWSI